MTARITEFNLFLRDHVNLNQLRIDTLHLRISSLDAVVEASTILDNKLEGSLIPQGSFADEGCQLRGKAQDWNQAGPQMDQV